MRVLQARCQILEEEAAAARNEADMERRSREMEAQRAAAELQSAIVKTRREATEQVSAGRPVPSTPLALKRPAHPSLPLIPTMLPQCCASGPSDAAKRVNLP